MVHGVDPSTLALDRALNETRTGDLWLFRGRSRPDRAIQTLTNAPVNHVGMTVAIDDLPPLIWHAELGDKLLDVWTGTNHRGVQLNDARQVVQQWAGRYRQRCWLRQLTPHANRDQEDKLLRVIHVGMTVAIDDLPPLIWHAELGDKLLDVWTGT
ncbi:hypothetical protein T581_03772, partial [Mycobacterium tuberculosis UT0048]